MSDVQLITDTIRKLHKGVVENARMAAKLAPRFFVPLSDYQIASFAYWKSGISVDQWQAHWRIDSNNHGRLTKEARRAYAKIWRSYHER